MHRTLISVIAAISAVMTAAAFHQQVPPNHPQFPGQAPTTRPGSDMPEANPDDVKSVDAIISAFYDLEDGERGVPRDWDRFRALFHPKARLMACRPRLEHPGGADVFLLSIDDYLMAEQKYIERGGYIADELVRTVEQSGTIAQVFSSYESRRSAKDEKPYSRGINSFQLLYDGERWWIVTILWDTERPNNPIPAKYQKTG